MDEIHAVIGTRRGAHLALSLERLEELVASAAAAGPGRAEAGGGPAKAGHDALFGTVDTWVLWNLTGGADGGLHRTDVTNASRTQLMNLRTLDWDDELLALFDIPRAMLPAICPSSSATAFGRTRLSGACGAEVRIGAMLGDQQAATIGQVCFARGEAKNAYGTGNFLLLNAGEQIVSSRSGLLTTVGFQRESGPTVYALEGSIAVTGSAVPWLRDQLGIITTAADIEPFGGERTRHRRRLLRAGVLGTLRAVLACRRAWRHRRPVPLPHEGAPGARNARGDLLPDARCSRR